MSAHGVVAIFDTPEKVLEAAWAANKKGMKEYESYTPFPVHGMEDALGLKLSVVPWATFLGGLTGFLAANAMQIWMAAVSWPINVGGKPMISYPAFVPIMFELTVLLAGLSTAGFLFFLTGMPNSKRPLDPRLTNDRFALYIPFSKENGDESQLKAFFAALKAERVSAVSEPV